MNLLQHVNRLITGTHIEYRSRWNNEAALKCSTSVQWCTFAELLAQLKEYDYVPLGAYEEDAYFVDPYGEQHLIKHPLKQSSQSNRTFNFTIKYYRTVLNDFIQKAAKAEEQVQQAALTALAERNANRSATFAEAQGHAEALLTAGKAGFVCAVAKQFDDYRSIWEYDVHTNGTITSTRPHGNKAHATFTSLDEFVNDLDRYYHINDFEITMA